MGEVASSRKPGRDPVEELVNELWTRGRTSAPASFVLLVLSVSVLSPLLRAHLAARIGYIALVTISALRWIGVLVMARRLERTSLRARYWLYTAGAVSAAAANGWVSLEGVRYLDLAQFGIWVLVVSGICGGATISMGSRPDVFFAFIGVTLAPLIVGPILWPREGTLLIAIAASVWVVYSIGQVRQYFEMRKGFFVLTTELDGKIRELDANNHQLARAQHETEAKNRELERKNEELVELHQRADRIFSALADALPGKTLAGKYKLEERIGSGGFAVVFRAMHVDIGRRVAVKVFRPEAGNDSAAAFERFRLEGASHGLVTHPNIVQVLDAGFSDGIAYIAMDLLEGGTLAEELTKVSREPAPRVAGIMAQVCRALAAAHAIGVIHRDVKPENIFLHQGASGETVKLLDFGVAKVIEDARSGRSANLTLSGMLIGTPLYMAPERFTSESCNATADIYSVGVMMYRALTGRPPFEGMLTEIMMRAVSETPRPVRDWVADVDPELDSVVMRALAQEPDARPSAAELAVYLERFESDSRARETA